VRPEECAQGVVELGFCFQVGKVAGTVDQEQPGALETSRLGLIRTFCFRTMYRFRIDSRLAGVP
jgi:hypothetical protein